MGWDRDHTMQFLTRWRYALVLPLRPRIGRAGGPRYPATVIEEIRNLLGLPANLPDPGRDWLTKFQEGTHVTNPKRDR